MSLDYKKKTLALFLMLLLFSSINLFAEETQTDSLTTRPKTVHDRLFAADKGHHFMVSAFIAGASFYAMQQEMSASSPASTRAAFGIAFSIGLAKEVYDGVSGRGTPSVKDIIADAAGIAAALLIFNFTTE